MAAINSLADTNKAPSGIHFAFIFAFMTFAPIWDPISTATAVEIIRGQLKWPANPECDEKITTKELVAAACGISYGQMTMAMAKRRISTPEETILVRYAPIGAPINAETMRGIAPFTKPDLLGNKDSI
ncbi:MAG: hypothetical protein M0Z52_09585 [Actinomycetota bacterium]|nr:hypothetical protein [Actinomycetota bacterium]